MSKMDKNEHTNMKQTPWLAFSIDRSAKTPVFEQICAAIRDRAISGDLAEGSKLPPTRVFATELGVSRSTIVTAYEQLVAEGYLNSLQGDWKGAGIPRDGLEPETLPALLMEALSLNDFPETDTGLHSMWAFAGDTTRHIFQHNETEYIESAHETAHSFPTSFYGNAFYGKSWKMLTPLNRVGGRDGWIATQVMETISSDGRLRRWQWELRKKKRPPNLNCWFVETIGSSDRKGEFEPE